MGLLVLGFRACGLRVWEFTAISLRLRSRFRGISLPEIKTVRGGLQISSMLTGSHLHA